MNFISTQFLYAMQYNTKLDSAFEVNVDSQSIARVVLKIGLQCLALYCIASSLRKNILNKLFMIKK